METDKIPQELPITQAPLKNEPIRKSFLNQKGSFLLLLGAIVIILVVLAAGGYLLTMNKNSKSNQYMPQPTSSSAQTKNQYVNTTLGFTLHLPDGWEVCDTTDGAGFIDLTPPPNSSPGCSASGAYTVTIAKYYSQLPGTPNPLKRQPGESFIDYVKQLDQGYFSTLESPTAGSQTNSEFKTIDSHTILETVPGASKGSPSKIMYIENPQASAFIITLGANGFDASNLQLIASDLTSSPITTGDITGQMSAQIEKNNTFSNTDTPTNFPVTLYAEDKSTIVSTTKTNFAGIYNFRVKPGTYYINDPGTGWHSITVSLGDIQIFNGGTITRITP